ncbi:hypothetical protein N5C66_01730 [Rhizobium pusense]|uniref:hypothetical protein n=1 Tax=Agrobacterium pusense TaxID=648995 RepID=UPI000D1BBB9C|nr:hypothetical protein [Agrobacterium pusense]MDH0907585.1 hypothetical protein [Agrobacterium pusense]MDH1093648.1 hypothetical protein [Agrobacterium pusense]MDH1110456.1 hypothetical protein [Agrobacterium pusense]MDH2194976.1 hypothetical protein [Agrobacterium pusense]
MKLVPRRTFLTSVGAGSVASAALASPTPKSDRLPRSLDSQLEECVAQLRDILQATHPEVTKIDARFRRCDDGTFRLSIEGDRSFAEYDGPGVYLVSDDGRLVEYFLERLEHRNVDTGEPLKGCFYFQAVMCLNLMPVEAARTLYRPKIVRKLANDMGFSDFSIEV